jgi:hypothetical protein
MIHYIKNQRKNGCNPKFLVKRLLKYPNVVKIQWYNMDHMHEDGTPTHGALDLDLILCTSFQVPHISKCIKEWIEERLERGFITKQIYEKHKKVWFNAWVFGIEALKDDYLNLKSIRYYENKMKKELKSGTTMT